MMTAVCLSTQQLFVFVSNCGVYIVIVTNCLINYPRGGEEGETQQSHVLYLHQRLDASSAGHSVPVVMVTVDFRLFVPSRKTTTQTDQLNAIYTEMSPSMTTLIGQFGFPFFVMGHQAEIYCTCNFHPPACDLHCLPVVLCK